jgi:HEPN domain-containing protein
LKNQIYSNRHSPPRLWQPASNLCTEENTAPRLHNLLRLAELAGIELKKDDVVFLADINGYNLAGRYPTANEEQANKADAEKYLAQAEEFQQWLMKKL